MIKAFREVKPKEKCAVCKKPAEFMGWVFKLKERLAGLSKLRQKDLFEKIYEPYCEFHFLEYMFGLYEYMCPSKKCREKQLKNSEFVLDKRQSAINVWVRLDCVFDSKLPKPKCFACGAKMISVKGEKKNKHKGKSKNEVGR